jgi:hypothetical protein
MAARVLKSNWNTCVAQPSADMERTVWAGAWHMHEALTIEGAAQLRCMIDFSRLYTVQDFFATCDHMWPLFKENSVNHFGVMGMFQDRVVFAPGFQMWLQQRIPADLILLVGDEMATVYMLPLVADACEVAVVAQVYISTLCHPPPNLVTWLNKVMPTGRLSFVKAGYADDVVLLVFSRVADMLLRCQENPHAAPITHEFSIPSEM